MKNDFIDVTGIEFQGEFGNDTCKGIEKPGKYIIRVIDNKWDERCYKDPVFGPIVKKLDSFEYGTTEYKEVEIEYNKLFDDKFGVNSDAWLPKEVDIVEIYHKDDQDTELVHTANKKWYYYNGNHRCFRPLYLYEVKEIIECRNLQVIK